MPERKPIFYSALLLTGVNLLLRLVSTSFQVYVSGRIGPAGVGLLQLVLSVGMLAMTAGMGGIRTSTMYLTAEELGRRRPENVSRILRVCGVYALIFSGVVALCLHLASPLIAQLWIGDIRSLPALRLYALFLPLVCLCGCLTGYFTAANRITTLACVEILEQLCSMGLTLGLLVFWSGDDIGKACCSVVAGSGLGTILTVLLLFILRRREHPRAGAPIPVTGRLLKIALPLALADDLKAGISTAENLMVPKRLALYSGVIAPLAAFGIVSGMVFPLLMFPAAILFALSELLIPELARCAAAGSDQRIRYLTRRSLQVAMLYGCTCCGILFLTAEPLCLRLYDNVEAAVQLRWYTAAVPMLYCDIVTDAMTKGLGQQRICVRYNILTSFMDVGLLFVLLPNFGMKGYFFSFMVTHLLNFILSLRNLLRITQIRIPVHIPLLTISALLGSIWGCAHLDSPLWRCGAFLLMLPSCLVLLGILSKNDFMWMKGLLQRKGGR